MTMPIFIDVKMVSLKNSNNVLMDVLVFHLVSFHVRPTMKTVSRTVRVWKTVLMVALVPTGIAPFQQQLLQQPRLLPPRPQLLPQQPVPPQLQLQQLPLQLLQHHLILFLFFTPIQVLMQKLQ